MHPNENGKICAFSTPARSTSKFATGGDDLHDGAWRMRGMRIGATGRSSVTPMVPCMTISIPAFDQTEDTEILVIFLSC